MKKILLIALALTFCMGVLEAQTVTIVSPAGLTFPYEVPAGTQVTFRWEHNSAPTAFYSSPDAPVFPEFGPDESWKEYTNFIDQGDGTYLITLTLTEPLHIFGAAFSSWIGQWSYSNVLEFGIASGVKITSADGLVCPGGTDAETLQVSGSYASYQWYFNNQPIEGATASAYAATKEGYYKVQVPLDGKPVFSSTLKIITAAINMTGALAAAGDKLTLTASAGMSSYQWLSGSNASSLTPVSSATSMSYVATLSAAQVYYAAKGVVAGCTVQSEARPASLALFAKPKINIDAPANEFGKVCEGTLVTLSVAGEYETYEWYNGADSYSSEASVSLTQGQGIFTVNVTPLHWPEVTITSAGADVKFFAPIKPLLTGVENGAPQCPGSTIDITLSDEGYTYAWYMHESFNHKEADKIEIPGYEYSFEFETATYLTVAARYLGCEASTKLRLDSYERATLFPELSDFDKRYLCEGSSVDMFLPEYVATEYTEFQWYALAGDQYVKKDGQTSSSYTVSTPGTYVIDASPKACPAVTVRSEPLTISTYQQREFLIESEKHTLCIGETTTLTVSEEWTNIQWFEKELYISNQGYKARYIPLSGAGTTNSIAVSAFKTYLVKAKHVSCPTGLKVSSQPFELLPTVRPEITPDPNPGIGRWHEAPYDSIANYLYCSEAPLTLSLPEGFTSYKWYKLPYTGDDDYAVGNEIAGEQGTSIAIKAFGAVWYTAKVESDGCVGLSRPVLIDTHVHNTPDVESRDNGELCGGDSTLLRVAFYGDWVKYEWYRDGELIPNSDNDSIYAKVAGGYNVTGYPSSCPHIGYSSGTPAPVTEFPDATIEQNEEVIYAMPHEGFYAFQWYRDGAPIETGNDLPHVIFKKDMVPGIYTVEVTNPKDCSSVSDGLVWTITGAEDDLASSIDVYPNPTTGMIAITGVEKERIRSVDLYDLKGQRMKPAIHLATLQIDMAYQPVGMYIVEVTLQNGHNKKMKVLRQ
jgi:hypothetical protein